VTKVTEDGVVFLPANSSYELHLKTARQYEGPVNQPVQGVVRAHGRKVYTVPSGGGFIEPIFGPPRIVQGRVRHVSDRLVVIMAGCPIVIELPQTDNGIDLGEGSVRVGVMVNATLLPGSTFD